jgi:hypothetical protein
VLAIIATVLAALIGLAVVAMGTAGMLKPQFFATFGIPGTAPDPVLDHWLTVKGGRDVGTGLMLLVVTALGTTTLGTPTLTAWVMLAATVMPVFDGLIVLRSKGPRAAAYGVHFATAAVMTIIATLLLLA